MKRISVFAFAFICASVLLSGCQSKADSPKNMPGDFAIRFSYWIAPDHANIYDTYNGTIQKDLVTNGTAGAELTVTADTLNEIYQKIYELELYAITEDMTSENLATGDTRVLIMPLTVYEITFTVDGISYAIKGDETASSYKGKSSSAGHFCQFTEFMKDIYRGSKEYKCLPEANGAYS